MFFKNKYKERIKIIIQTGNQFNKQKLKWKI